MKGAAKARVLVVEDHPIYRDGLTQLINRQGDLEVCAEADSPQAAIAAAAAHAPDLVMLDLTLQGTGGTELIKQLRALFPQLPILVLSMHDEAQYAERVLRAGAAGYLMKQEAAGNVIGAMRTVLAGELHMSRKLEVTLLHKALAAPELSAGDRVASLSDRELQVFELIGASIATREISTRLGVSIKTIETHRENIKRKLELANAAQLLTRAQAWVQGVH